MTFQDELPIESNIEWITPEMKKYLLGGVGCDAYLSGRHEILEFTARNMSGAIDDLNEEISSLVCPEVAELITDELRVGLAVSIDHLLDALSLVEICRECDDNKWI